MFSVATKAELPPLLLARMQTLTIAPPHRGIRRPNTGLVPGIPRPEQFSQNCFYNRINHLPCSLIFRPTAPDTYNKKEMKARVYVSVKPTVLDPQGQTICSALQGLGHREITSVRQGKYFEIGLADATTREQAQQVLDQIGRDVLSNPVIEDYRVEIID